MNERRRPVQRALISVSDKTDLQTLARRLIQAGVELLSTGGTAGALRDAGIDVTDVSAHTGFPEIMDGRVKTLHPKIHGGILGRRGVDDEVMAAHDIAPIDLVVVNLYPFQQTVSQEGCSMQEAVEQIDIGGPAMIRAAAKNHRDVTVVVDPADYARVAEEIESGGIQWPTRRRLAATAFSHTAAYDAAIAAYLGEDRNALPQQLTRQWIRVGSLRYGENPHQSAAVYREPRTAGATLASTTPLQGKALSYNNLADADAALSCVSEFEVPACVIVKHANPCGVAEADTPEAAYAGAFACDPSSAFGGIIAFNRALDEATAASISRQFVEVIVAPDFAPGARAVLAGKPNLRLLAVADRRQRSGLALRTIDGGVLAQEDDIGAITTDHWKVVSSRAPGEQEFRDLLFAWRVVRHVKSNAIVFAGNGRTCGIGAGQTSRVMSVAIAGQRMGGMEDRPPSPVMASDAFFPFRDGIDEAAKAGIRAIVQPGGSKRDEEVIAAADEYDMAMVFTGVRHFRH